MKAWLKNLAVIAAAFVIFGVLGDVSAHFRWVTMTWPWITGAFLAAAVITVGLSRNLYPGKIALTCLAMAVLTVFVGYGKGLGVSSPPLTAGLVILAVLLSLPHMLEGMEKKEKFNFLVLTGMVLSIALVIL
jgi:hypothetical protein